jgi:hypothetical protein
MRITHLVAMVAALTAAVSSLGERRAVAAETAAAPRSDDHPPIALLAPPGLATDPGSLRCECASPEASDWHWNERRILGLKALGFGVLAGAAGLVLHWDTNRIYDNRPQSQVAALAVEQRIHDRQLVSLTLVGVAGVSLLAGAALVLWPGSHHVSVMVLPSGGALVACGGAL